MTRVQIPVWTDRWMMGDRFGTVVKTVIAKAGKGTDNTDALIEIAHVKLDKSGKTIRVRLEDCEVVS